MPDNHAATFSDQGASNITHPTGDYPDCDFDAYLAADWANPGSMVWGDWEFYRAEEGHWNGLKIETP